MYLSREHKKPYIIIDDGVLGQFLLRHVHLWDLAARSRWDRGRASRDEPAFDCMLLANRFDGLCDRDKLVVAAHRTLRDPGTKSEKHKVTVFKTHT